MRALNIGDRVKDLSGIAGTITGTGGGAGLVRVNFGQNVWRDLSLEQLTKIEPTAHTPGPWNIRMPKKAEPVTFCFIQAEGENLAIAKILAADTSRSNEQAEANAALIARAPEIPGMEEKIKSLTEELAGAYKGWTEAGRRREAAEATNAELLEALKEAKEEIIFLYTNCPEHIAGTIKTHPHRMATINAAITRAKGKEAANG